MSLINLELKLKSPPLCQSGGSTMDGLTGSQLKINGEEEEEEEANLVIEPHNSLNDLKTSIDSLPDEIVFDILGWIPAQDIYCAVWPVCLKWYQLIRTRKFVVTHLHRSTYGLLIQNQEPEQTQLTFMELSRQGRIELTRLNYEPGYRFWCSSCNGLVLECERNNDFALYVTNPVTLQHFSLPPSPPPFFGMSVFYSALAYASLSMEYKVVRVYCYEEQWCCAILTVGVDESWRTVITQHLSLEANELLGFKPSTTQGFVHWPIRGSYVLTLNVESEIIVEYPMPYVCYGDEFGSNHYYFSTVKYLSMLIACQSCRGWVWEVWEMEPETGDWTKLPGVDLMDRKCEILGWLGKRDRIFKSVGYGDSCWLVPVGWLEYKEVLIYRVSGPNLWEEPSICIAWDIRLKKLEFIELDSNWNAFFAHRNSLVWLD